MAFHNTRKRFQIRITLPANMTGVVYLPRKASRDQIRQNGLVVKAAVEGAFWKIEGVGAGTYERNVY